MGTSVQATWQQIENMIWGQFTPDGCPGSGNFRHAGRPGEVGGSAPAEGASEQEETREEQRQRISSTQSREALANLKALRNALKPAEDEIRVRKTEKGYVFSASGQQLFSRCGTKDEVKWPPDKLPLMRDCTLTHNHPNSSTFSVNDVKFAVGNGLRRIRAVCPDGKAFELERTYNIWDKVPSHFKLFGVVYEAQDMAIQMYLKNKAAQNLEKGMPWKQIQKEYARDYNDYARHWLEETARDFGWRYTEE